MNNLIKETIASYNHYLGNLPDGCQIISNNIREDRIQEAMKLILQFSEGVGWLIEVNQLLHKNGYNNPIHPEQIHKFLEEINFGLEVQDFVIVADMFEYEIKPFFENAKLFNIEVIK